MGVDVLGISGSPIKNSNTDRLVTAVLQATGVDTEFVKLSDLLVRPCMGCKKCVTDNICKTDDDFPALAEKIQSAKAIVIGAYTPYSQVDGFTKALLERFWSFRHVNNLLRGKLCATVVTSLASEVADGVNQALAMELVAYERMELLGQMTISGNLPCLTCGKGDACEMSAVTLLHGKDAKTADNGYCRVEEQSEVWGQARVVGKQIRDRLKG